MRLFRRDFLKGLAAAAAIALSNLMPDLAARHDEPVRTIYVLDMSEIKVYPLRGKPFMLKTGYPTAEQILADYGFKSRSAPARAPSRGP